MTESWILRRATRRLAVALFLVCTFAVLGWQFFGAPQNGQWVIDEGIKLIAMQAIAEQGFTASSFPLSDPTLDPQGTLAPYGPPFVVESDGRQVTVFSPLFLWVGSFLFVWGGVALVRLFVLIGALIAVVIAGKLFFPSGKETDLSPFNSNRILISCLILVSTPLLFYSVLIWEHTWFVALALGALALRLKHGRPVLETFAGFLAVAGGWLRPEGMIWALALTMAGNRKSMGYYAGMVIGLCLGEWLQFTYTGTLLPSQWTENLALGNFALASTLAHFPLLLGRNDLAGGAAWVAVPILLLFASFNSDRRLSRVGLGLLILYIFVLPLSGYLFPVSLGTVASSSGWLVTAPASAVWWFLPDRNRGERWVKISIGLFVLLATIIDPVPNGVHHGPRVLLPALVLGMAGGLSAWSRLDRSRKSIFLLLIMVSIWSQCRSMPLQLKVRNDNAELKAAVQSLDARTPLVLSGWHFGGDLGEILAAKRVVMPGTMTGWKRVIGGMRNAGETRFVRLALPGTPGPETAPSLGVSRTGEVTHGWGWELTGYRVEEVSTRTFPDSASPLPTESRNDRAGP